MYMDHTLYSYDILYVVLLCYRIIVNYPATPFGESPLALKPRQHRIIANMMQRDGLSSYVSLQVRIYNLRVWQVPSRDWNHTTPKWKNVPALWRPKHTHMHIK